MKKEKKEYFYFRCILANNEEIDFKKKCTLLEEFGASKDMISFKEKNLETGEERILRIIPKMQIKQIISVKSEPKTDVKANVANK